MNEPIANVTHKEDNIIQVLWGVAINPAAGAKVLIEEAKPNLTFILIGLYAVLYAVFGRLFEPFSSSTYLLVARDFSFIIAYSAFAALFLYITARFAGGSGTFRRTLDVVGYSAAPLIVLSLSGALFQIIGVYTPLMFFGYIDLLVTFLLFLSSVLVLLFGVREVHRFTIDLQTYAMIPTTFFIILGLNAILFMLTRPIQ